MENCQKSYSTIKQIINYSKRLIASVIITAILMNNVCYAQEAGNATKHKTRKLTYLLEQLFEKEYETKFNTLKEYIKDNDLDYYTTVESFYQEGNPFNNVNYINVIAMYSSIKQYCKKNDIDLNYGIYSIEFLNMDIELVNEDMIIPKLYPTYEKDENDDYRYKEDILITAPMEVDRFVKKSEGSSIYVNVGKEIVEPDIKQIKSGKVTLTLKNIDEILKDLEINDTKVESMIQTRITKLNNIVNERTLNQSTFVRVRNNNFNEVSDLPEKEVTKYLNDMEENDSIIVNTALSLVGQIPYEWGGKAKEGGYDNLWWTFDNESNKQKGLDCSGFVQWTYMTCGFEKKFTENLLSTRSIISSDLMKIEKDELKPGDIGILNMGETTNHTGIYLGGDYFIHCSSAKNTVTVSKFPFKYFYSTHYKSDGFSIVTDTPLVYNTDCEYADSVEYLNNDIYLLAQLIENEAGNQGYNGWVGIAEVVLNRMQSTDYPNTVKEVIYQESQFSNQTRLKSIRPREEVISVAEDVLNNKLKIFNNPDVLYFRNPTITDGIAPEENVDWNDLKYLTCINEHAFYTTD